MGTNVSTVACEFSPTQQTILRGKAARYESEIPLSYRILILSVYPKTVIKYPTVEDGWNVNIKTKKDFSA